MDHPIVVLYSSRSRDEENPMPYKTVFGPFKSYTEAMEWVASQADDGSNDDDRIVTVDYLKLLPPASGL